MDHFSGGGSFIAEDGKAAVRRIKTGGTNGDDMIVTEGLSGGEAIIVEGLQALRPGTPIKPNPLPPSLTNG